MALQHAIIQTFRSMGKVFDSHYHNVPEREFWQGVYVRWTWGRLAQRLKRMREEESAPSPAPCGTGGGE